MCVFGFVLFCLGEVGNGKSGSKETIEEVKNQCEKCGGSDLGGSSGGTKMGSESSYILNACDRLPNCPPKQLHWYIFPPTKETSISPYSDQGSTPPTPEALPHW